MAKVEGARTGAVPGYRNRLKIYRFLTTKNLPDPYGYTQLHALSMGTSSYNRCGHTMIYPHGCILAVAREGAVVASDDTLCPFPFALALAWCNIIECIARGANRMVLHFHSSPIRGICSLL